MRTINLIFAIVFIACTSAFANNNIPTNTTETTIGITTEVVAAKTIDLQLENVMTDRFTVRLKDADGTVLFFEKVKNTHQYAKRFTLNQLVDGDYYFAIDLPTTEEIKKPFVIVNNRVNITNIGVNYMAVAAPRLVTFEVKAAVANAIDLQLDNSTIKACKVRIKDEHGHVIYFEKVCKEKTIAKRYLLDNLPAGNYTLEIETGEGKLIKTFSLQNKAIIWKTENAVAKA